MKKNSSVIVVSIIFFFVSCGFIFAQRPAIKPFNRDAPDFTPDKVKVEDAGRPRCPQNERVIGLETARCVSDCFSDIAYKYVTGKDPEKPKSNKEIWDCKEKCEKTGVEERKLYKACVEALHEGIKDEFEIFNAAVIKLGGYLDITHADGAKEVLGIDVGTKEIKDGDILNVRPKTMVILHFYNPRTNVQGDTVWLRPGTSIKFINIAKPNEDDEDDNTEIGLQGTLIPGSRGYSKDKNTVIDLPNGKVWVEVFHYGRDNNFIYWTPNVWVSDKGTEFIVSHDPDRKISDVYVFEGTADVNNWKGKTIQLQAGEAVAVDSDDQMALRKMSQEESEQLKDEVYSYILSEGETGQSDATTAAKISTANKTLIFGLVAVLLCVIGAGVYIYRKRF